MCHKRKEETKCHARVPEKCPFCKGVTDANRQEASFDMYCQQNR